MSNWIVSLLEDVLVVIGVVLAMVKPLVFFGLFVLFCLFALWLLPKIWRGLRAIFDRLRGFSGRGRPPLKQPGGRGFDLSKPNAE